MEIGKSFFELALDAASQAAVASDRDSLIRYWNPAAELLYGYTAAEAIGQSAAALLLPDDERARGREALARLEAGQSVEHDFRIRTKDGRELLVHYATTPVFEDGSYAGALGLAYDISAQREAETRAAHLASIIEGSADAIIDTDLEGIIRSANAAVEQVFGYTPAELIGQRISLLIPKSQRPQHVAAVVALMAGESVEVLSTVRRRKDGTEFESALRLSPVCNPAGEMTGISGICRDVSARVSARKKLEESERRFRARFDQVAIPQAMIGLDGDRAITVNDAMCRLLGLEHNEFKGQHIRALYNSRAEALPDDTLEAVFSGESDAGYGERVLAGPDGNPMTVLINAALLRADDGSPHEVVVFVNDLTARKKADQALRRSQDRYRVIADAAQEGIWAVGVDGHTLYANNMVSEILGIPMRTIDEQTAIELLDKNDSTFIADKLRGRHRRGPEKYELQYQHPDGRSRSLRFSTSPLLTEDGVQSTLAMIADVTEARRGEEELRRRALHDPLTGLANRTLLMDRLDHALNRRQRKGSGAVAVVLADLEQFKLVNDTWGHAVGDELLQQVAQRLRDAVREGDTVARFGGDEFAIVTEDSDESQAHELAGRLRDALALPFDVAGQRAHVSASVGIAVSPPQPGADLLRFADAAMYEAKAIGPGRIQMFDVGVAGRTADRLGLSGDLREALSDDHLRVFYQPLVDLANGSVVGVEALARWTHPSRGEVEPTQFVAVAEATGLAPALDQWVLSRVCADLAQLRSFLGDDAPIAVNISARHLGDADLDDHIAAALRASGASGHGLALEITETALMVNAIEAREVLEQLRSRGLQ
ncbi:MAG: hypothetical protein QOF18_1506, partial [Frankiaceae bacterium]|nr:hypothetical protein [Frankiaceae bacterium]